MRVFLEDYWADLVKAWLPNSLVLGAVTLSNVETCFKIVLLGVSILYTVRLYLKAGRTK